MIATEVTDAFAIECLARMAVRPWKAALIRVGAKGAYNRMTASYADLGVDEVQGAGYVKGGAMLKNAKAVMRDGRACLNFDPVQFVGADFAAIGAMIYASDTGTVGCTLNFGATFAAVGGGTFVLPMDCPIRL